jgi:hypothetical protein
MSSFKDNSGLEIIKPKTPQAERDEQMKKFLVKGKTSMPNYDTYKPGSYHDYDVGGDNRPIWIPQPKNPVKGK